MKIAANNDRYDSNVQTGKNRTLAAFAFEAAKRNNTSL